MEVGIGGGQKGERGRGREGERERGGESEKESAIDTAREQGQVEGKHLIMLLIQSCSLGD